MSDVVISVENLSKVYTIRHQRGGDDGLRHAIHDIASAPFKWLRRQHGAWSTEQAAKLNGNGNGLANSGSRLQAPGSLLSETGSLLPPSGSELDASHSEVQAPSSVLRAPSSEDFWALRDVSFEVKRGEVVGIIGRNGAGKSTLLKILSNITEPTSGRARIRGRVASLLEVGTGFHPELTGRENIFLNGAILGMSRDEIKRKFDEIVEFSGVEKFIDTPVKRYSSGMHVRLAFAVAAHLEPEILIIDEVLAVGDAEFQKKCLGKMNEVAKGGRTVLFVSHNMAAIEGLCTQGILLEWGSVSYIGQPVEAIAKYVSASSELPTYEICLKEHPHRTIHRTPVFCSLRLTNDDGETLSVAPLGKPVTFKIELKTDRPVRGASLGLHICDMHGRRIMTCHSRYQTTAVLNIDGELLVQCRLPSCRLMPGRYSIVLGLAVANEHIDRIEPAMEFEVAPVDIYGTGKVPPTRDGIFVPDVEWVFGDPAVTRVSSSLQ